MKDYLFFGKMITGKMIWFVWVVGHAVIAYLTVAAVAYKQAAVMYMSAMLQFYDIAGILSFYDAFGHYLAVTFAAIMLIVLWRIICELLAWPFSLLKNISAARQQLKELTEINSVILEIAEFNIYGKNTETVELTEEVNENE